MALLRVLAIAGLVFVITRWLRKALSRPSGRAPSGKPWWDNETRRSTDNKPKLKTLKFKRNPYEVLGIERGASQEAVESAYLTLLAKNSPESVAGMSEDIQALAKRNTEEINEAYAELKKDTD